MIEKMPPFDPKEEMLLHEAALVEKINELVEAYNNHVHYAREMQFPTSTPNNPEVY